MQKAKQIYVTSEFSNETAIDSADFVVPVKAFGTSPFIKIGVVLLISASVVGLVTLTSILIQKKNDSSSTILKSTILTVLSSTQISTKLTQQTTLETTLIILMTNQSYGLNCNSQTIICDTNKQLTCLNDKCECCCDTIWNSISLICESV